MKECEHQLIESLSFFCSLTCYRCDTHPPVGFPRHVDSGLDTCTGLSAAEDEDEDIIEESPTDHPSVFSCLPASLECLADTSDSCFLQFEPCPLEESWFITPPPCFTAGGLTTLKVETSPMENLLIEHPSMSVYAVHNSCPGLHEASCGADELHNASGPRYVVSICFSPQAFWLACYFIYFYYNPKLSF